MINMSDWSQIVIKLRRDPKTPIVIAAVFGLLTVFSIWGIISDFLTLTPATKPISAKVAPQKLNVSDLHLMGIYDAKTSDIPTTQLQLTLEGTVISTEDSSDSYALIQSPGQPTKVYKIGDQVPGDAKIEKIEQRSVILNDNGQLQKLNLPEHVLPNIQLSRN